MEMNVTSHMPSRMPPGTEYMRESDPEGNTSHEAFIPHPSNDPSDPLNWSPKWKWIVVINQSLYVFFSIVAALSIAPVTPIFVQDFQTTPGVVSLFTGVVVIVLGYSNFIIVPFSNLFGRRAACLATGVIILISNIWQAVAQGPGSFYGARALNGLGAGVNESLMVQVRSLRCILYKP